MGNFPLDNEAALLGTARASAQYTFRKFEGRIFSYVRYFATVRRAMTMPFSFSIFTTSWSDNGLVVSSLLKISAIMSLTLVLETPSPVAVWMPAVKKYFGAGGPGGGGGGVPE